MEASAKVLDKDLDGIHIQTKVAHGSLGQYNDMEREHMTVLRAIRNEVDMAQKREEESTVTTLKTQVSMIDSFYKKMVSALRASTNRIKELAYTFNQLRQMIRHM